MSWVGFFMWWAFLLGCIGRQWHLNLVVVTWHVVGVFFHFWVILLLPKPSQVGGLSGWCVHTTQAFFLEPNFPGRQSHAMVFVPITHHQRQVSLPNWAFPCCPPNFAGWASFPSQVTVVPFSLDQVMKLETWWWWWFDDACVTVRRRWHSSLFVNSTLCVCYWWLIVTFDIVNSIHFVLLLFINSFH